MIINQEMFVRSFELMLNVPVNSNRHVGTLPRFHGTFTHYEDVMTPKKCFKYKLHGPSKPQSLIRMDDLIEPFFIFFSRPR